MVAVTDRDMDMIAWLDTVRLSTMDSLRYALAGLTGADEPVSLRRAQQWVARMREVGLVDRSRPVLRDGSVVWATHIAVGRAAPKLLRQTMRHDLAVAAVSARYLVHGYEWRRDHIATHLTEHQGDGIATKDDRTHLVEVELTSKTLSRYKMICFNHGRRIETGDVTEVVYLATSDAARTVDREADKWIFHTTRKHLHSLTTFDSRGDWINDSLFTPDHLDSSPTTTSSGAVTVSES